MKALNIGCLCPKLWLSGRWNCSRRMDISLQNSFIIPPTLTIYIHCRLSHLIIITFICTQQNYQLTLGSYIYCEYGDWRSWGPELRSVLLCKWVTFSQAHEQEEMFLNVGFWARVWRPFPVKYNISRNQKTSRQSPNVGLWWFRTGR